VKNILMAGSLLLWATTAGAQDWVVGFGYTYFSESDADDSAVLSLEYHHEPFFTRGRWEIGAAFSLSAHTAGDVFAGVGISGIYQLNDRWFLEGSVLPGLFIESSFENDLGSAFEIRSLLGLGYALNSGDRLSLAITHKSNASTSSINPGVNAVQVRWRRRF